MFELGKYSNAYASKGLKFHLKYTFFLVPKMIKIKRLPPHKESYPTTIYYPYLNYYFCYYSPPWNIFSPCMCYYVFICSLFLIFNEYGNQFILLFTAQNISHKSCHCIPLFYLNHEGSIPIANLIRNCIRQNVQCFSQFKSIIMFITPVKILSENREWTVPSPVLIIGDEIQ